jgi:hypothetical protein
MTLVDALGGSVSAVPLLMRVLPRGDGASPRELRAALQRLRPLLPELHP